MNWLSQKNNAKMVNFAGCRDYNPAIVRTKHCANRYGMPAFALIEFLTKIHKFCESLNIDFARKIPE